MRILPKALTYVKGSGDSEKYCQKSRLIHYITWEFITVGIAIGSLYALSKLGYLVLLIGIAISLALFNLWLLNKTKNTMVCSHIMALIIFATIVSGNYLIWGMGPLHSQWFYVMPLLAATLTGIHGLFIYSIASLVLLLVMSKLVVPSYYDFTAFQFTLIEWINHFFAYLVIFTTLASLIHENNKYEEELNNKNYLLQEEKDRYHYLARFDPLTNLPNRRYFIQHLHELIESLTTGNSITVFFIDLDNFKLVNDSYGHNTGDQLLLETSRRLQSCFREKDFISRLGGDEFTAIILHAVNKNIPEIIVQRIIHEFEQGSTFENNIEYHYSISVGFATYPSDAQSATDLVIKADLAMYAAKKTLGNSYCAAKNIVS
jgi:diguanylate cyclase (GGDEF)-like protein